MTPAMYFGVRHAVNVVNDDASLAGLLITGTGDVFIPGGDMGGEYDDFWDGLGSLGMDLTPFDAVRHSAKPVVSAINGICQGGGLMMAMLSDVAVASDRATFRAPELLRGISDTNYAQILPRQIGPARARDMLLTGRTVAADEAVAWGLVARVAPHDQLIEVATEVLIAACRSAPVARADVKRSLDAYYGLYDRIGMVQSLRGPEALEGYHAFRERRPPSWIPPDLPADGRL